MDYLFSSFANLLVKIVVDQEVTSDNVKKTMAQMGAEKLAELGIEGIDEATL